MPPKKQVRGRVLPSLTLRGCGSRQARGQGEGQGEGEGQSSAQGCRRCDLPSRCFRVRSQGAQGVQGVQGAKARTVLLAEAPCFWRRTSKRKPEEACARESGEAMQEKAEKPAASGGVASQFTCLGAPLEVDGPQIELAKKQAALEMALQQARTLESTAQAERSRAQKAELRAAAAEACLEEVGASRKGRCWTFGAANGQFLGRSSWEKRPCTIRISRCACGPLGRTRSNWSWRRRRHVQHTRKPRPRLECG